jgi:FtsH-binding integral membrane protein
MAEDNISGSEQLAIIESMIKKAKNQFSENGHLYLLWGWAVFICSSVQFILLNFVHYEKHYFVWFGLWLILIYQFFYLKNKRNRQRVRTYTDEIVGFVWIAFFILMILFLFLYARAFESDKYYLYIFPAFLALYGMPSFLSGIILKFRPLITGGIGCWFLSVIATFIPAEYHLLLISLAMIIAWIIPGYLLRKKFKKQTL